MRQPRGRRKGSRSLHLSLSATDEEWEIVRHNAAWCRKSIARYLVGLALGEDSDEADSAKAWNFCGELADMSGMREAVR